MLTKTSTLMLILLHAAFSLEKRPHTTRPSPGGTAIGYHPPELPLLLVQIMIRSVFAALATHKRCRVCQKKAQWKIQWTASPNYYSNVDRPDDLPDNNGPSCCIGKIGYGTCTYPNHAQALIKIPLWIGSTILKLESPFLWILLNAAFSLEPHQSTSPR